jgi:cephalosporin-C deacetylase-like acetyl esterase
MRPGLVLSTLFLLPAVAFADDTADLKKILAAPVLTPRVTVAELQEYLESRIPEAPVPTTAEEWTKETERLQKAVLDNVVFRGEAAKWRDAKTRVEYGETLPGEGYSIKKVRYEIIPGFWIPALLYEPEKLQGKVPVMLAVNGHDRAGKAANYKQIRCINLAKRGMIVLNTEWLGMGQLNVPGNGHGSMNQLDLCGTSGLAPFYLSMSRGLDLLLDHKNADPARVAVSGLSGGGWQTITISGLDPRVTLSNPVAGYSSFLTRIRHFKDLGDSEQTPTDLAKYVDYTHLTAMRAPWPTLLTFNAKDNCCFEAGYALPPLERASRPFFKLFGKDNSLRTHINEDPGDHNFGLDNREALYRMIGDHFFADDKDYSPKEIACDKELKTPADLTVELPKDNLTMNAMALKLATKLPPVKWPDNAADAAAWQKRLRAGLRGVAKWPTGRHRPEADLKGLAGRGGLDGAGLASASWIIKFGGLSIPVQQLGRGKQTKGTVLVVCDGGRVAALPQIDDLLKEGYRILAADLYYFGEMHPYSHDWLWSLTLATVGERPLGIQAAQLDAVARWSRELFKEKNLKVVAVGPRTSTIALIAAALDPDVIAALELHEPLGSFKEIIEENRQVRATPELFCFGLLDGFDIPQIAALVAPRPIVLKNPSERAKKEFAPLAAWYKTLGKDFNP